jgi:hypothetical protein
MTESSTLLLGQNFQTKSKHSLCSINPSISDNVGKYCAAVQTTDVNITQRMRLACHIPKATNTHTKYITFIAIPLQN